MTITTPEMIEACQQEHQARELEKVKKALDDMTSAVVHASGFGAEPNVWRRVYVDEHGDIKSQIVDPYA